MNEQVNQSMFRDLLNSHFARGKMKNSAYSVRAFSQKLGLNHSAVSEILNGKRKVGIKLARRLADSLMLEAEQRSALFSPPSPSDSRGHTRALLEADQFKVIADWYHFAILSLAETKGFKSDVIWIARRLGIHKSQAKDAVERLCRLQMMRTKGDRLFTTGRYFSSPDGISDLAVRRTHHQYLEMAGQALTTSSVDERDFTAVTMAIDPRKLPEAKRRVRAFRDDLCAFLESGDKKEVFEMCLQIFPLTKEV